MENVMDIPLIPKIIALLGCAIVFGLVCTYGVLWPWLASRVKGVFRFVTGQGQYSTKVTLQSEHLNDPRHPKVT